VQNNAFNELPNRHAVKFILFKLYSWGWVLSSARFDQKPTYIPTYWCRSNLSRGIPIIVFSKRYFCLFFQADWCWTSVSFFTFECWVFTGVACHMLLQGISLCSGQKIRICIARALYSKADLVILVTNTFLYYQVICTCQYCDNKFFTIIPCLSNEQAVCIQWLWTMLAAIMRQCHFLWNWSVSVTEFHDVCLCYFMTSVVCVCFTYTAHSKCPFDESSWVLCRRHNTHQFLLTH